MNWSRLDDYRTVSPPRPSRGEFTVAPPSAHASNVAPSFPVLSPSLPLRGVMGYRSGEEDGLNRSRNLNRSVTSMDGGRLGHATTYAYGVTADPRGGRPQTDFGVHHAPPPGGSSSTLTVHGNLNASSYIYEGRQPFNTSLRSEPQLLEAVSMDRSGSPLAVHHHYYGGNGSTQRATSPPSIHHHYQSASQEASVLIPSNQHHALTNSSALSRSANSTSFRPQSPPPVSVHHHYPPPNNAASDRYYRSSVQGSGYLNGSSVSRDAFLPPHIVQGRQSTNSHVMWSLGLMKGELLSAHVRAALLRLEDDEREFRGCIREDYERAWGRLTQVYAKLHRQAKEEEAAYNEEEAYRYQERMRAKQIRSEEQAYRQQEEIRAKQMRDEEEAHEHQEKIRAKQKRIVEAERQEKARADRIREEEEAEYREEQMRIRKQRNEEEMLHRKEQIRIEEERRLEEHRQQLLLEEEEKKRNRARALLEEHDRLVRRGEATRQEVIGAIESDRSQVVFERKIHQMEVSSGPNRGVVEVPYEFEVYQSLSGPESASEASARGKRNETRKQKAMDAAQAAAAARLRAETLGGRSPGGAPPNRRDTTSTTPASSNRRAGRQGYLDFHPSPLRSRDTGRSPLNSSRSPAVNTSLQQSRYLPSIGGASPIPMADFGSTRGYPTTFETQRRSNSQELSTARRRRSAEPSDRDSPPRGYSLSERSITSSGRKSVHFNERSVAPKNPVYNPNPASSTQMSSSRLQALHPSNLSVTQLQETPRSPDRRRAKAAIMSDALSL